MFNIFVVSIRSMEIVTKRGFQYDTYNVVGLRDPDSHPCSANGAFVIAMNNENNKIISCVFVNGAQIICNYETSQTILYLMERNWEFMGESDLYVTCHGMGLPSKPFWLNSNPTKT